MIFPKMYRIRQTFDSRQVENISSEVEAGISALHLELKSRPGQTVAVACIFFRGIVSNTWHLASTNPDISQIDVRPRLSIDSTRKLSSVGRNH